MAKKFRLSDLNPAQREAVEHINGPLLILAGAGTGKTRTVTARIAHMIDEGVPASQVLAVTFTNKAANEMRERVGGMVSEAAAKKVTVCTFHSLCVRILRVSIEKLGYKKNFSIYSGSDQLGLIRKIMGRYASNLGSIQPGLVQSLISRSKNKGIPVDDDSNSPLCDVERGYNRELKLLNAVDFDDLLILGVEVLKKHPDVREEWQRRFRYIMVDEFQDTNRQQMQLVQALAGSEQNVCVVGDDDQSIYGWRGAEISNILDFERFFYDPKVIKLEQNYRSTTPILHTANSIIRHNQGRREKSLWSENPGDDRVRVVAMPGDKEEAQLVVDEILEGEATEQRSYDDFAVLFRTNGQSRLFETLLRENKIPYRVIGGMSFYDRREVKDLLAYLMVLANPEDDVSLLRVINNPPRGIGAATIEIATERSQELGRGIGEVLETEEYQSSIPPKSRGKVREFLELMDSYRDAMLAPSAAYGTIFAKMVEEMGYIDYVKRLCKTDTEKDQRASAVAEFLEQMRDSEGRRGGLQKFLDNVALQSEKEDDLESQQGVSLITMHAAKGLEFQIVYLVGAEEGILPHRRSMEEGTRDEERRLFYVGITRAMERLTISFCATRIKWGEPQPCQRSTFLDELDPTYLDVHDYEELAAAPIEEDAAMDYFAKMKAKIASGD